MNRLSQRGVALVITLIMLSLITVLTVVFLALSRRERASVTATQDLTDAELAAEGALNRAKADLVSQVLNSRNLMGFDLSVSRARFTNGIDLSVPVFVDTNRNGTTGPLEGRAYLDLNRNYFFDTNGPGVLGDPEWIGITDKYGAPHSKTNPYIARMAYVILPSGKALDVNYIHNASTEGRRPLFGYMRNQGFGSWELNLAAFFADLTPTVWNAPGSPYSYGPQGSLSPNTSGAAFADAFAFLRYRYGRPPTGQPISNRLPSVRDLYGAPGVTAFERDQIDGYANGMDANNRVETFPPARLDNDVGTQPWAGAPNTNHFFTHQEFWDTNRTSPAFVQRLRNASSSADPFERSTFYRMIGQLSTDSTGTEASDKIHLNYVNLGGESPTNFVAWTNTTQTALMFFTNVAERLLRQQYGFGVTNIPVSPTNFYTPGVHRLLQVAANIYEATRTNAVPNERFPAVFRPLFSTLPNANVVISGYEYNDSKAYNLANLNPHGIPLIIAAKKGLPNFNEFTIQTVAQVSRKLELVRPDTNSPPRFTNQMYFLGLSNNIAIETWNSYTSAYPRPLTLEVRSASYGTLSNQFGVISNFVSLDTIVTNIPSFSGNQFILPLYRDTIQMSNMVYRFAGNTLEPVSGANRFEQQSAVKFPVPDWYLNVSNRFAYVMSEGDRIIDFVHFSDLSHFLDMNREVLIPSARFQGEPPTLANVWITNRARGGSAPGTPTLGIQNQIEISAGYQSVSDGDWSDYSFQSPTGPDKTLAIEKFKQFLAGSTNVAITNMQAPFSPLRRLVKETTWQANDPLVHTHLLDLTLFPSNSVTVPVLPPKGALPTNNSLATLMRMNDRYSPWRGNPNKTTANDPNSIDFRVKDPGVKSSDDWDFPTGPFASVGVLGRVHRGTPWQTIYLKAESAPNVGPDFQWNRQSLDYAAHPTNDWRLVDLFTVAPNENASRGRLSINQANLPSWSAVLGGVVVLANPSDPLTNASPVFDPVYIEPAGIYVATNPPALVRIFDGIQGVRTNAPNANFTRLSQFLAVPELTSRSPYLDFSNPVAMEFAMTDEALERIPQQILSLLRLGEPRAVIYAYGQALRPTGKDGSGNVTNYQVSAEFASRTVIRLEDAVVQTNSIRSVRAVVESFNLLPPE